MSENTAKFEGTQEEWDALVEKNKQHSANPFLKYRRTQLSEMRFVTDADIRAFEQDKHIHSMKDTEFKVSISQMDLINGSPKIGDMIARNPENHLDQWLVAEQYFKDNFEPML